ncbi:hypothetical protein MMC29_005783, partial [Sticta canariensis]|nr:hypothetical protein [Sticta canariensis]
SGGGSGGGLHLGGLHLPKTGLGAINALKPFASQTLEAFSSAGRAITNLAGGRSEGNAFGSADVSAVADLFSSIFGDASDLAAAGGDIELSSFGQHEISDIINMQDGLNNLRDLLRGDLSDIKRFISNPPSGLKDFKRIAAQFGVGGTFVGLTGISLNYIVHYGDHKNNGGNDNNDSGSQHTATTQTGTATLSTSTATPTAWLLNTVPGTSREAFEDFVSKLPDHGSGRRIIFPALNYQNYVAKMTLEEAKAVSKYPIVDQIGANDPMVDPDIGAEPEEPEPQHNRREVVRDSRSPQHLRIISLPKNQRVASVNEFDPNPAVHYTYDVSGGAGSYVYVLDCGFDFGHVEFEHSDRGEQYIAQDLKDSNGNYVSSWWDDLRHGTSVASLAVGKLAGVAKSAGFIGVKFRGNATWSAPADLNDCWGWIVNDVVAKNRIGKATIVMSYGFSYRKWIDVNGHVNYGRVNILPPRQSDFMLPLLRDAWDHKIVTVVSVGNQPKWRLGDRSPQRFGRVNNALITVGALDERGERSPANMVEGPAAGSDEIHLVGSTTVYAQGRKVKAAKAYGTYEYRSGSSFAAPLVAGLAAYLAGLPGSRTLSSMEMKQKIVILSRSYGAIDAPGLIYNGVRELQQACPPTSPRKARRRMKEVSVREELEEKTAQRNAIVDPTLQGVSALQGSFGSLDTPPEVPKPLMKPDPPPHNPDGGPQSPDVDPKNPKPPQPPSSPPKVPSPPHDPDPDAGLQPPFANPNIGLQPEDPDIKPLFGPGSPKKPSPLDPNGGQQSPGANPKDPDVNIQSCKRTVIRQ